MKNSYRLNKNVNPKDYIKAHMTKEEIQGLEAAQGNFTSIDSKTGLREFSHLIPLFKNHHVLNLFENLEKQLSDLGDLDELHKVKYEEASKKRPKYIETASEKLMKEWGRGDDKHLVLLPKSIAEFFIKIKGGSTTVNPKTGFLEFGRKEGETKVASGKTGSGQSVNVYRTSDNKIRLDFVSRPPSGRQDNPNNNSYSGTGDRSNYAAHPNRGNTQYPIPDEIYDQYPTLPPGVEIDRAPNVFEPFTNFRYYNRAANRIEYNRDPYAWGGTPPATTPSHPPLKSILQYGATILGHLLGGPIGGLIASNLGSAIGGDFNASTPTRIASELASQGSWGNPLISLLIGKGGNKLANSIPLTPQAALTQHLEGNLNYGMPGTDLGRIHFNEKDKNRESAEHAILNPKTMSDELYAQLAPKRNGYELPTPEHLKQKTALHPSITPEKRQFFSDPFSKRIQQIKEKEELTKNNGISTPEIENVPITQNEPATLAARNIINPPHAPILNNTQKQFAVQEYEQKNPINKNNPFQVREDADRIVKNAYHDFYKTHAREISPYLGRE